MRYNLKHSFHKFKYNPKDSFHKLIYRKINSERWNGKEAYTHRSANEPNEHK